MVEIHGLNRNKSGEEKPNNIFAHVDADLGGGTYKGGGNATPSEVFLISFLDD